jgi:predicted deacetylase
MREWLKPIADALHERSAPLQLFIRDDDAGWDDARLVRLVELCDRHEATLDLAVIPTALSVGTGAWLAGRIGERLRCHQHGFAHVNHAQSGRKCEFGTDRGIDAQHVDLRRGWSLLNQLLQGRVDEIFTPPWNRCSQRTADALGELGFLGLSRDAGAAPLRLGPLRSLPVHVNWMKPRLDYSPDLNALAGLVAQAFRRESEVGLMLHHAVMTGSDFDALGELLELLRSLSIVEFVTMKSLLPTADAGRSLRRTA